MKDFDVKIQVSRDGVAAPEYKVGTDLAGELTLRDLVLLMKTNLVAISGRVLAEEQSKGFTKDPVRVVDGSTTKPVAAVNPFGTIEYAEKAVASDTIIAMFQSLIDKSPMLTSLYLLSHIVMVNRTVIATNMFELKSWFKRGGSFKTGDSVFFVNTTPYAGMLEREGITSGKRGKARLGKSRDKRQRNGPSIRIPSGVYYRTARNFQRSFRGNFKIFFDFINGNTIPDNFKPTRSSRQRMPLRKDFHPENRQYKGPYVYPAIRLYINEGGSV